MTKTIWRTWYRAFMGGLLLVLAACGGGGGSGGGATVTTYTIGGTVSGLVGDLVLQNNGGDDLSLSTNDNSFTFDTRLASGAGYNVRVKPNFQPQDQYCTVSSGTGTVANANVTGITVTCSSSVSVGGTVTGLTGTLTLQNNPAGGPPLVVGPPITDDGTYAFTVAVNALYAITVNTQPAGQVCTVSNGTGTATVPVTNVAVSCVPAFVTIGGTLTGLAGGLEVTLRNNGGPNFTLLANGNFTFPTTLPYSGSAVPYNVTVQTQPVGQICTVGSGSGSTSTNVTDVSVSCVIAYTIGVTVSGLVASTSFTLQNNGGDDKLINGNGVFVFSTLVAHGAGYNVTAKTYPTDQLCTVSNGAGTATANVNLAVTCVEAYTIGGTISGLGGTLVLRNNGKDDLTRTTNGAFTFVTPVQDGTTYAVTIQAQPSGQACNITNPGGSVANGNVTNVLIGCPPGKPTVVKGYAPKQIVLSWDVVSGADYYKVSKNPDGDSGFSQIGPNEVTGTSYADTVPVHLADWVNMLYLVEACNDGGCTPSDTVVINRADSAFATGYVKASNTGAGDQFGSAVAVSGDGDTIAVGAPNEDSAAIGVGGSQTDGATDSGAVYVYVRNSTTGLWSQQAYIKASNTGAGDNFGWSVALSNDGSTLAVGAPYEDGPDDNSQNNSGAAYVFTRDLTKQWSQQAYVKSFTAQNNNLLPYSFGSAVTLSNDGDTLAVGAFGESSAATGVGGNQVFDCVGTITTNCLVQSGAVYVFIRSSGSWSQQAYVKPSDNTVAQVNFGIAVALSGDSNTLAVGAYRAYTGAIRSGAVYVFTRSGGNWSEEEKVNASDVGLDDDFGQSVALSTNGDTLAVGADFEDSGTTGVNQIPNEGAVESGAAYVFSRSAGNWSQDAYIKASNTLTLDHFGYSVALSGDGSVLAVGSYWEDGSATGVNGNQNLLLAQNAGAAYVFKLDETTSQWSQQAYVKAKNTGGDDKFGYSLGLSSDGNTLAIGANLEDGSSVGINGADNNGPGAAGAVYLY